MSNDWAEKYISIHRQRQQEQQHAQKRADLAQAGAPDMFQRIQERLHKDLQTFHDAGAFHDLKFKKEAVPEKFVVSSSSPFTRLEMELSIVLMKYKHSFIGKHQKPEQHLGALRVCADLNGLLRVYRNGNDEAFVDESDVSEFLLRPLLNNTES